MTMPDPRRPGFTLVEVMVATVISAIVVTAVLAAVSFTSDAHARRLAAAEPHLREHAVRLALQGWLRAASIDIAPFVGIDRRQGGSELDELTFGVADGGSLHPGPARIRLWTELDGSVMAQVTSLGGRAATTERLTLATGADGLALRYRTRAGGRRVWVDSWDAAEELPEAVLLRVIMADPAAVARTLHDLPLLLQVGWEGR
jgi:prepilin-type N-terminal cleavage/methylation domain-containing protein